jgi:serine/threonine protein kinase/tetratricopeptide (TPR) repeat protein/TolB-like protein
MLKRALEIVDAALELSPEERSFYLDRTCSDPELRQQVESLLLSSAEACDFLDQSALFTFADVLSPDHADSWLGRRIGPYILIEEIGEGGMGTVYRAVRADDQYRKEVAIKRLRSGSDNASTLTRFKTERQILANLEHPNIARLLDGGTTEEGLPYFVMELVAGQPIDQYCDLRKLSITERLKLFRTVCSAVHCAHSNFVIHRDLKPGNILVTTDGIPKLLDFGIAKIVNLEFFQSAVSPTATMMRILTPEYASPEQVRGEKISTASDVYSLGVTLYLLLTGRHPYSLPSHAPHEIVKAVCEAEPQKPSTAVTGDENAVVAALSNVPPKRGGKTSDRTTDKLRRQLSGDLDNIVLKALRKEPSRRYASVEELSEDIRRHLEGLPVLARKDTVRYRFGKFVMRNVPVVSAASLLILAVLVAIGSIVWQRHIATQTRLTAKSIIARPSVAVLGFKNLSGQAQGAWLATALSEMFATELTAGEKLRTIPGENVARMKADLSLQDSDSYASDSLLRIRKNLATDFVVVGSYLETGREPDAQVRIDLHLQDTTAGQTLTSVSVSGNESQLADLVSGAVAQLRTKLGAEPVTAAEKTAVQAAIPASPKAARIYAEGLAKLRVFDALGARTSLEKAIAADPNFALGHSALASALSQLGYEVKATDEAKRAFDLSANLSREDHLAVEAGFREMNHEWGKAIDIYRTLYDFFPDNVDYGLHLARVQISGGKGKDALSTIETLRRLPGPAVDDPRIDLAETQAAKSVSDYKKMLAAATRAYDKAQRLGARMMIARARLAEAVALRNIGNPNEAVSKAREAESIFLQAGDREGAASALNNIGNVLADHGDSVGEKQAYEESLAIYQGIGNRVSWARVLGNLALLASDGGDFAGAERLNEQVLRIDEEIGDQQTVAETLINMANDLYAQGDFAGAMKLYRRALKIATAISYTHTAASALSNMGVILTAQGNISEAVRSFEEALRLHRAFGQEPSTVNPLEGLGDVLFATGDLPGATEKLQEAMTVMRKTGEQEIESSLLADLGAVFFEEGDFAKAKANYGKALELDDAAGYKPHLNEVRVQLAELDLEQGHLLEAVPLTVEALKEFETEKLRNDQTTAHSVRALVLLAQQKPGEAMREAERAQKLSRAIQSRYVRLKAAVATARVDAASGRYAEATKMLTATIAEAKKCGFLQFQFEARLARGEIELKLGQDRTAKTRLLALEKESRSKSFVRIADKAAAMCRGIDE